MKFMLNVLFVFMFSNAVHGSSENEFSDYGGSQEMREQALQAAREIGAKEGTRIGRIEAATSMVKAAELKVKDIVNFTGLNREEIINIVRKELCKSEDYSNKLKNILEE